MHHRTYLLAASVAFVTARLVGGCSEFAAGTPGVAGGVDGGTNDDAGSASTTDGAAATTAAAAAYREAVVADGPLVYWRMNRLDPTSRTVVDEMGTGNALSLLGDGHTLGPGPTTTEPAIRFNGTSSFARANDSASLAFVGAKSYTIELWARREEADGGTFKYIVGHAAGYLNATHGYLLYANVTSSPTQLGGEHDAPDAQAGVFVQPLVATGTWAHLALVFDAAASTLVLYVNGVATTRTSVMGRLSERPPAAFHVARDPRGGDSFWPGSLAEIAVYARALSFAEVSRHHRLVPRP